MQGMQWVGQLRTGLSKRRAALPLAGLASFALAGAVPALAAPDFSTEDAIGEWLEVGDFQPQSKDFSTPLQHAVAIAFQQRILSDQSPWKVEAIANYSNGSAWPVATEVVQVSQSPEAFLKVVAGGVVYLSKKADPAVRLVGILRGSSYLDVMFNPRKGGKAWADELLRYVKEEVNVRSIYRSRAIEIKETGQIGFVDRIKSYKYDWDSIVLEPTLKARLRGTVDEFLNGYDYARWREWGLPMSRGILLDGPPGTGKSMVAKVLLSQAVRRAYKNEVTFIYVAARHIISKGAVRDIYSIARLLNPAVVFIEDIDLVAGTDRTDREDVKNELMQQLSGIEELNGVLTIGTTNVGDRIDEALKRSKRLGFQYTIGNPAVVERIALFTLFTQKHVTAGIDFRSYVDATEGLSGADIQDLVDVAVERAIRAGSVTPERKVVLTDEHFRHAVELRRKTRMPRKKP